MKKFDTPLDDINFRGRYAREISNIFNGNNMDWIASAPVTRPEIFIRPKDSPEWEKFPAVSRMSIQIKDGVPSFGVSGYFPWQLEFTIEEYKSKGYTYHDKEGCEFHPRSYYNENNRPSGRWWLTKTIHNMDNLANEIRDIEHLLYKI